MSEPTSGSLAGTVKYYERHVFICTGGTDWAARLEQGGGFAQTLAEAVAVRANDLPRVVKLTACNLRPSGPEGTVDLLIFPDMVRYSGVRTHDVPDFVGDQLVANRRAYRLSHRPLSGQFVFVCCHAERDARCGQCGPTIAARFRAELKARRLEGHITLAETSHVGGHAMAGNVLLYPRGDWYGRVTPDDVPRLIELDLLGGQVVRDIWRGRLGLLPDEQMAALAG